MRADILQAVAVRKDMPLGSSEPQEDLPGRWLAPRSVQHLDLSFLDEIVVLHDRVQALDAVRNIHKPGPVGWVEGNSMVFIVDAEICNVAGPVGYPRAQYRRPQSEIILQRAAA